MWASFLFDAWLTDIETCLKVAPTELWREIDLQSNGFGIEAEVTGKFLTMKERIFEVPISYRARGREQGKKIQWTDGIAALWILLRIRSPQGEVTAVEAGRLGGRPGPSGPDRPRRLRPDPAAPPAARGHPAVLVAAGPHHLAALAVRIDFVRNEAPTRAGPR